MRSLAGSAHPTGFDSQRDAIVPSPIKRTYPPCFPTCRRQPCLMSERDSPRDTWSTLLSDLQTSLTGQSTIFIPSESGFHKAFLELCTHVHECDPQRLLGKFLRQHAQIIAFTGAIDESIGLTEPPCLSSLFWSVAFTTVKVSLFCATSQSEVLRCTD